MKKILTILACVTMLILTQACGNKKDEKQNNEATIAAAEDSARSAKIASDERRARIKREREEYAERRRIAADERAKANATYKDANGKIVYYAPDVLPSFRGSQDELEAYIRDNIDYPAAAQNAQVEGTVFVDFVVGADGVVRDVEVSETTSDDVKRELSTEAVRVVSNMPDWTAGTKGSKPVDVRVSLPITFQLD